MNKTSALSMTALLEKPGYKELASSLAPQLRKMLGAAQLAVRVPDKEYQDGLKAAILESEHTDNEQALTPTLHLQADTIEGAVALLARGNGRPARALLNRVRSGLSSADLMAAVKEGLALEVHRVSGQSPSTPYCRDLADMLAISDMVSQAIEGHASLSSTAKRMHSLWEREWSRVPALADYLPKVLGMASPPDSSESVLSALRSLSGHGATGAAPSASEEQEADVLEDSVVPGVIGDTSRADDSIRRALGLPWWVSDILASRGIKTKEAAEKFLKDGGGADAMHDHWEMHDMGEAVSFLHKFRGSNGRRLCIFGDYDLDGVSGASLMYKALQRAGWKNLEWRLPSRFDDEDTGRKGGYGISVGDVERMAKESPPVEGLVLVDTGTNAHEAIDKANELGILVLVVDHHQPEHGGTKGAPKAHAMLNPWKDKDRYPNQALSAVGVAHKLVSALYDSLSRTDADDFLDYVGLGMLADHMDLTPENRHMIHKALSRISSSKFPGIAHLCKGLEDPSGYVPSQEMAFKVNPVLNAPGRLGKPDKAMEMLISSTPEEAAELGKELKQINENRKAVASSVKDEAMKRAGALPASSKVITVFGPWHQGVGGTVASQLVEHYGKPVAIAGWDSKTGKTVGSARAVDGSGFDWNEAIQQAKEAGLVSEGGGHKAAAGFTARKEDMERLRAFFEEYAAMAVPDKDEQADQKSPSVEVPLSELGEEAMGHLAAMEPFGPGNPQPVLVSRGVYLSEPALRKDGKTVSFKVSENSSSSAERYTCVMFGKPQLYRWLAGRSGGAIDIAYQPSWNTFGGRRSLQLLIKGVGPTV